MGVTNMHPADEFLMHYGVAGMKWGKRRARTDDEKAASKAKAIKIAKVVGTVAVAAAITAGAIYAGKQMNARAGQRAIADFDNSELRDIVQSGKLFSNKVASKAADVKVPTSLDLGKPAKAASKAATSLDLGKPTVSSRLASKAKSSISEATKPATDAGKQAAIDYGKQVAFQKIMAQATKDRTTINDVVEKNKNMDTNVMGNINDMLKSSRL